MCIRDRWRTLQLEGFAEGVFQIAAVAVGNVVNGIAVHDNDRRIGTALVGIARLGPEQTMFGRRLPGHGIGQHPGKSRGG